MQSCASLNDTVKQWGIKSIPTLGLFHVLTTDFLLYSALLPSKLTCSGVSFNLSINPAVLKASEVHQQTNPSLLDWGVILLVVSRCMISKVMKIFYDGWKVSVGLKVASFCSLIHWHQGSDPCDVRKASSMKTLPSLWGKHVDSHVDPEKQQLKRHKQSNFQWFVFKV